MVVKNAYAKIVSREFRESFGRFAAIFGIVALGVGFLSGLLVTTPDMHNSVDEYYDNNNMADIFIKATMGLTEEDLSKVESLGEVHQVMPAYVMDMLADTSGNGTLVTRIYGLPLLDGRATINKLELLEGRMPENKGEVLVERSGPYLSDISLGSIITISPDNDEYGDIEDYFEILQYRVVGVVGNTFHFSMEREMTNVGSGRLGAIVYADRGIYAMDSWTDFYLTATDALQMDSFSKEYEIHTDRIVRKLEDLSKIRSQARYVEIRDKAQEEIDDGWKDYYEGKEEAEDELSDAWQDILDGRKELDDALMELRDGEKEIQDSKITLREEVEKAQLEISDGERDLADALIELEDGEKELADALLKLQDGERDYYEGYLEYLDGKRDYQDGLEEYEKGERDYEKGLAELEDGKRELERGERSLERGRRELQQGEEEYAEGSRRLEEEKQRLLAGVSQIATDFGIEGFTARELVETEQGKSILRTALGGAREELDSGIEQVQEGIQALEKALSDTQAIKLQLNDQLEMLLEDPEAEPEDIEILMVQIETLDNEIMGIRNGLDQLQSQLDQLQNGLAQLPDPEQLIGGWNQILAGEKDLQSARRQLDRGWDQYYQGRSELRKARADIEEGEKELLDARKELDDGAKKLEDARKELLEGERELLDARMELDDGWKEYNDGLLELEDGWRDYEEGVLELEDARITLRDEILDAEREIADGEEELGNGWKDYYEGLKELQDGEREYGLEKAKAERELEDAYAELVEAEEELDDLQMPKWYVLDRRSNMSFASFQLNADKVAAIAKVFPIFFYLVAALVSLTTMTRMVEEERTQIGVLKALGFRKPSIIGKYVIYCGLASILGSIAGQLVGFKLIPRILWNAYGVMYHLPPFVSQYNTNIALVASGIAVLSTVGVTFYAANEALREKPATLMLPRAPKAGKRILLERAGFIWRRMSFNMKSTARNIFRYKKHFYMTVVGISGCTALLVTGFGMRDSIGDFAGTQFNDIFRYQINVELDEDEVDENTLPAVFQNIHKVTGYVGIHSDKGVVEFKGNMLEATAMVFQEAENLSEFILLRDRETGELLEPGSEYVIITEKLSEVLRIGLGDEIRYEDSDGLRGTLKVSHITENYIGNYIYIDRNQYESSLGRSPINGALVRTQDLSEDEEDDLVSGLLQEDGVLNAEFVSRTRTTFDNLIVSIDYIVVVIIIASGLLAIIVLYNLTNINITERKKELATLKVLGFHNEEVAGHIFREITILTLMGIMLGLILGTYLHEFIIKTVENTNFMFGRDIKTSSYILSGLATLVFSFVVNVFMGRKIRRIEMVESMKAND